MADGANVEMILPKTLKALLSPGKLGGLAARTANFAGAFAMREIQTATPIDSQDARNAWHIANRAVWNDPQFTLSNNQPHILALEYGSELGEAPWPNPTNRPEPPSTVMGEGLNSGKVTSSQAPEGMIRKSRPAVRALAVKFFRDGVRKLASQAGAGGEE